MIVCLFGPSCVGKTTLALRVSAALGLPLRSCGDAVRAAAKAGGVAIDDLPDERHREIDAATVAWALQHDDCLVEGRFLDRVFTRNFAAVTLISLAASDDCRVERAKSRNGNPTFSKEDLRRLDEGDNAFCGRLYGENRGATPWRVFDTSGLTVDACAHQVKELVRVVLCRPPA